MGKAPAFQLYASDFYMDTADWTCPQIGVYVRLLMYEWVNGGLSPKISDLARIAKVDSRTMHKCWSLKVANKFTYNDAGLLINQRLEKERDKQSKYKELQTIKGKHGAQNRWNRDIAGANACVISNTMPVPQPNDSSSSSSSIIYNNKEKISTFNCGKVKPKYYKDERGNYVCSLCQKPFMEYQNLQDHFKEHKGA